MIGRRCAHVLNTGEVCDQLPGGWFHSPEIHRRGNCTATTTGRCNLHTYKARRVVNTHESFCRQAYCPNGCFASAVGNTSADLGCSKKMFVLVADYGSEGLRLHGVFPTAEAAAFAAYTSKEGGYTTFKIAGLPVGEYVDELRKEDLV